MGILISIAVFIIILLIIVIVHEWGHFKAARMFGIRVDEFGFGFPPKIWGKKIGETEYTFNWIPLGGFVKIFGESREGEGEPDSFVSKPIWQRMIVILGGVFMNWVLAFVLLTIGFWYGLPQEVTDANIDRARDVSVAITQVSPGSPAENAGIKLGDSIVSLSSGDETVAVSKVSDVQNFISKSKGNEISVSVKRGDELLEVPVIPEEKTIEGEKRAIIGVGLANLGIVSSPWYLAPLDGLKATWTITVVFVGAFYEIIKNLIFTGSAGVDLSGPIGIGVMTYQFTQLGFSYLIQFTALLSLNLFILNALPIPALDGGRFLFLLIEAIKGSPVSKKVEMAFQTAGIVLLIILMILVTIKDVVRFF